jgi:AmmeMemoRadiSam system protein A
MPEAADLNFSDAEKTALLRLARQTLETVTRGEDPSGHLKELLDGLPAGAKALDPLCCFVSLFTASDRLRGCIGCTETEKSLAENVQRFAEAAALEDPRFRPVSEEEARALHLRISVLGPCRRLAKLEDIEIGRHGLSVRKFPRRGVLLASVAKEWNWSRERFFGETLQKAGIPLSDADRVETWYFEEIEFSESTQR